LKVRAYRWWISGAAVVVAAAIGRAFGPGSDFAGVFFGLSIVWVVGSVFRLAWWVWNRLTYRVGTRLFISYLMVGVLPVLFAIFFGAFGLYILMGQYTSVRLGSELRRVRWELAHQCDLILQRAELRGNESAEALLKELAAASHEPLPRVAWQARLGDRSIGLEGGEGLPDLTWLSGNERHLTASFNDGTYGVVSSTSSGNRVTAFIPLDEVSARAISNAWWFDVAFIYEGSDLAGAVEDDEANVTVTSSDEAGVRVTAGGRELSGNEIWPKWSADSDAILARPLVLWFRSVVDVVDLETGQPVESANLLALLRTSPANVWHDFTLSRYELGQELWGVLAGFAALFLVGYGLALAAAATVVFSIARSTSRLTVGARQVELGNLDYRVPVKRRDQLGDLGRSFNHMTASVQSMLDDVAEKERLARELELAREIQQRLLPARELQLGSLTVRAVFQPAAEVGGDYFDVFQVAGNRLLVMVGDVAGHGLSTGLLMAGLKSSVAAMVHEGYSGAELIAKVNRLLLEQGKARTMVTMVAIDVDPDEGRLVLANAGHPPPYLMVDAQTPRELFASALPMGNRLCRPAEIECELSRSARVLLYSDGLVEAASPDGEPFGYDRLRSVLEASTEVDSDGLISSVLTALSEFVEGVPLADDLTLLVIERSD
jgi:HAMP domain-containing protein